MAKVILLNSSPRANSNTHDVLEVCAEEIEKMVLKLKSYP